MSAGELVRALGQSHGSSLFELARARDDRPVVSDRATKSVSVEDTFEIDLVDPVLLAAIIDRHARSVCERLVKHRLSGRTVTVKVRRHDFSTHTRSATLAGPTDRAVLVSRMARRLLEDVDTTGGVRLLGVGVSGLSDWIQDDLFAEQEDADDEPLALPEFGPGRTRPRHGLGYPPGMDVMHTEHGPGWVWGAGLGRVTVRFETAETGPGPVRTFPVDDPALRRREIVIPDDAMEDEPLIDQVQPSEVLPDAPVGTSPGPPA
ncbi:MAG: hypothetical protein WKF76_11705 [Nocardioidaceae bacterium]